MVFSWSRSELSLYLLILFYCFAGLNHFIMPEFYLSLIPELDVPADILNRLSGTVEIILGVLLLYPKSRKWAVYGILLMLIGFVPVHWQFIVDGSCLDGYFCIPNYFAHFRLWVIHPLLMYWAWTQRNNSIKII